jgi:hypothetical protein
MFRNFSFLNLSQFIFTAFPRKTDVSTMAQKHMRNINVVYIFSSALLSYCFSFENRSKYSPSSKYRYDKGVMQFCISAAHWRETCAGEEVYMLPTDTHVGCRRGGGKYCYEPAFTYDPGVTLFLLWECCFFLAPSWVTFPKIMGQNMRCKELPIFQRYFSYNLWSSIAKRVCSICLSWRQDACT